MIKTILSDIAARVTLAETLALLKMPPDTQDEDAQTIAALVAHAAQIARPKAVYGVASVTPQGDERVLADGVIFHSALVRKNLEGVHRIFPYVATCGVELELWAHGLTDMLEQYWADAIQNAYLQKATKEMREHMNAQFGLQKVSSMRPGSLAQWPLTAQRDLFALIGDVEADIGVRLTESCLMLPGKSVSGFCYTGLTDFNTCTLCPIESCPNRHAPRDPSVPIAK